MSRLRAFTMPKWGIEMQEGRISEWSIQEGAPVAKGQTIVTIESDKIVNEVQAEFDTRFVRLIGAPGETYPVGALLGVMASEEVPQSEVDVFVRSFAASGGGETQQRTPPSQATAAPEPLVAPNIVSGPVDDGINISPAARELAQQLGVDLRKVTGTGRGGRISLQDVQQAAKAAGLAAGAAGPSAGAPQDTPSNTPEVIRMSPMRKAIARQLCLSKQTIPHYYLRTEVNLDSLIALRASTKQHSGSAPSLNDYLLRAAALALAAVPDVNIQVHGDEIHRFAHADVAVAVATDKGLITPILRAADTKSVSTLAQELRPLVERARSGQLRAEEIEGGTFTVSNLGMFGVQQFDAIINPPQGAILAIGAAQRRQIERNGGAVFASVAQLSLSCDHRAIDGALGGRFLQVLRELIESPQRL